jgi:hypothetical protein
MRSEKSSLATSKQPPAVRELADEVSNQRHFMMLQ